MVFGWENSPKTTHYPSISSATAPFGDLAMSCSRCVDGKCTGRCKKKDKKGKKDQEKHKKKHKK
jgi:hypothetical protein